MFLLLSSLLLISCIGLNAQIVPRLSCRDHFLAGNCDSAILPLTNGHDQTFHVQCKFPPRNQSGQIETIIHNALELQHTIPNEFRAVGYQVSDPEYLAAIINNSTHCQQSISIAWSAIRANDPDIVLKVTSATGNSTEYRHFDVEGTGTKTYELAAQNVTGVIYLTPQFANYTAGVQLSPLRCYVDVPKMENCSVALNHTAIKPFIADSRDTDFTNLKSSLKLGTPNGTLLHWTHTAPKNQRITEWRVQMRLPELSYNYQKFMEIGDFIISSGGNGKTLFVTIKTNTTAYEAFSVDSSDARLHLIAVKEVGTNAGMAVYNIYVDNHPPRSVRVPQFNKSVPITIFSSSTVDSNAFMGCINGIWFGHKDETNNNAPFIDFFKLASENEELREDFSLLHNVDYTGCGIYDEDKWTSESSSFGRLTSFDQYAKTSGSGILFYILVVASIVLSFVLIVIFVVSLILTKKRRNESKETQTFN